MASRWSTRRVLRFAARWVCAYVVSALVFRAMEASRAIRIQRNIAQALQQFAIQNARWPSSLIEVGFDRYETLGFTYFTNSDFSYGLTYHGIFVQLTNKMRRDSPYVPQKSP